MIIIEYRGGKLQPSGGKGHDLIPAAADPILRMPRPCAET
jgi:hypothetical protein